MAISSLEQHIAEVVSRLTPADQQKVLDYARLLSGVHPGSSPENLLRFAGMLSHEDVEEMERALREAHDAASAHE